MKPSTGAELLVYFTPSATAYRPGDTVTALLQVLAASEQPVQDVELHEVEVECGGIERVDCSWVSPAYRRGVAAINADKRRVERPVFQSRLQAATQGDFSDASLRRFIVRLALPAWLPPTFRGTSTRYSYYLQATVRYRQGAAGEGGSLQTASTKLPIHIWPAKSDGAATPGGAGAGDDLPVTLSPDATIKCWEIGPGTAVPDAVSHILRMASAPEARPSSAGSLPLPFAASSGSLGGGRHAHAGSVPSDLDDASSEISHDDGDAQGRADGRAAPGARRPISRQATGELERLQASLSSSQSLSLDGGASSLKSYALRIGDQPLVRVSLHPPVEGLLHPGATVAGTLDFPGAYAAAAAAAGAAGGAGPPPPRCMQVLILLETEEAVDGRWRPSSKSGAATGGGMRRVYGEQLELTQDTACSHFIFSLPPDAPASFHTPLLALRWVLRFQFVASTARPGGRQDASPLQGSLETLGWTMPLTVVAPPL